ncbi:MAG: hypothetical protein ACXU8A_09360 [Burkholderiaceae bacterium]
MSFNDHQKQLLRTQNEKINNENAEGFALVTWLTGIVTKLGLRYLVKSLWTLLLYSSFLIVGVFIGRLVYSTFPTNPIYAVIGGVLAACAAFLFTNWIDGVSNKLRMKGNRNYIPLRFLVLIIFAGIPFYAGLDKGYSAIRSDAPFLKIIAGCLFGLLLSAPAIKKVMFTRAIDKN